MPAIRALAAELVKSKTLSGEQTEAVIRLYIPHRDQEPFTDKVKAIADREKAFEEECRRRFSQPG